MRIHNYLVCKRTLNQLSKLVKWLSCVVGTYPYGAFTCVFIISHTHLEWTNGFHDIQVITECRFTLNLRVAR